MYSKPSNTSKFTAIYIWINFIYILVCMITILLFYLWGHDVTSSNVGQYARRVLIIDKYKFPVASPINISYIHAMSSIISTMLVLFGLGIILR